jgi:hypothetical protein
MYRGHVATIMREVPGTAAWFGVYEAVIRVRVTVAVSGTGSRLLGLSVCFRIRANGAMLLHVFQGSACLRRVAKVWLSHSLRNTLVAVPGLGTQA